MAARGGGTALSTPSGFSRQLAHAPLRSRAGRVARHARGGGTALVSLVRVAPLIVALLVFDRVFIDYTTSMTTY